MLNSKCIVILGAGPAGLSAALWLRNLGFEPHVIDSAPRAGGLQNLNFLANDWVLGQTGQTGPALAQRFVDHVQNAGVPLLTGVRPVQVSGAAGCFQVRFDNGEALVGSALLIATGTRYRAEEALAGVVGIDRLAPEQIAYGPYAFADLDRLADRRLLIIGGGDNAYENARLLAPRAAQVHLAVRGQVRAQQSLAAAVAESQAAGRCHVWRPARLRAVQVAGEGGAAELLASLSLGDGDSEKQLRIDRIHVLAGYEPNTRFIDDIFPEVLATQLSCDELGYLRIDGLGRTGATGIYAAGDVCNSIAPSVVSAIAEGARVAKTIEMDSRIP